MVHFDQDFASPLFRNLSDPMVSYDPNPYRDHDSSYSSHDDYEALRVPPKQFHKISTKIDKMHD